MLCKSFAVGISVWQICLKKVQSGYVTRIEKFPKGEVENLPGKLPVLGFPRLKVLNDFFALMGYHKRCLSIGAAVMLRKLLVESLSSKCFSSVITYCLNCCTS